MKRCIFLAVLFATSFTFAAGKTKSTSKTKASLPDKLVANEKAAWGKQSFLAQLDLSYSPLA